MSVLLLGGTSEAHAIATRATHHDIITSFAGRVANPKLPNTAVRIGGFGGVTGLITYLTTQPIAAVVDATHPFATTMTEHAIAACRAANIPLLRCERPPWPISPNDIVVKQLGQARNLLAAADRVMLTTGRSDVSVFADSAAYFLIRVVDDPTGPLPQNCHVMRARGPYHYSDERHLLQHHNITTLITKNSGGQLTWPKVRAAHDLNLRVIMVDRPAAPDTPTVYTIDDVIAWLDTVAR